MLDLSKIEAGKLELEHAPFHLPSLVHDARSMFSDQARAKGLALSASIASDLNVVLLGDAHRLLQILTNLVSNALKFTNEGGVTIGVNCLEDRGDALHLRFTVTNSGIGVPAGKQEEIFRAFSQADSSTTRRYGGTGLGLSIARQLCQRDGWRNWRRQCRRHGLRRSGLPPSWASRPHDWLPAALMSRA